jgi:hypothetical protein
MEKPYFQLQTLIEIKSHQESFDNLITIFNPNGNQNFLINVF